MSLWHIAWSYLWNRKLTTIMTILSVALAVGLISAVLVMREETRKRFEEEGDEFDIVVGAKGAPLQLVLSSVYFLDAPTGNIRMSDLETVRQDDRVKSAYPILLGDSYQGTYRIVGTDRGLMDHVFERSMKTPFKLADGRYFEKSMEAVIGARVAEETGLKVNDTFVGTHGYVKSDFAHVHEADPYTVVGIMEPSQTPNDRAVFCDMKSVWDIHAHEPVDLLWEDTEAPLEDAAAHDAGGEHEDHGDDAHEGHPEEEGHDHAEGEAHGHAHDHGDNPMITAVLVTLRSPTERFEFMRYVNDTTSIMAAVPILEIQKLYNQFLGMAKAVLLAIGYLVVVISALSILIGLYLSIIQRKRDLAVMRALGASAGEIFGAVIIEAFWISVLGLIAGWFLGSIVCWGLSGYLTERTGFTIPAFTVTAEMVTAYSIVLLMGMLAGILPAWQAYRTDIARDLAEL